MSRREMNVPHGTDNVAESLVLMCINLINIVLTYRCLVQLVRWDAHVRGRRLPQVAIVTEQWQSTGSRQAHLRCLKQKKKLIKNQYRKRTIVVWDAR